MMTLAQLITASRGTDSYETVAKRAGMATSVLHKFALGKNADLPPVDTVFALAKGLNVRPSDIVMAAAQGLGIDMEQDTGGSLLGRVLPPEVDALPDDAKRAIVANASAMVALMVAPAVTASSGEAVESGDVPALAEHARTRISQGVTRAARRTQGSQPG